MIFSNVTIEEITAIKQKHQKEQHYPTHIRHSQKTCCRHAEDTGALAFANLPCRGNKIICKKVEGYISYTAACTPGNCKFFEVTNDF